LPATWVFNFVVAVQTWRGTEIGKWSAATETHLKGFYAAPVAETSQTSCLVIPPRVVYAMKNWDRTIEGVALAIESIIPVGFYRTVLKAWKRASAEIPFEFENLGYDHDYRLLEQIIPSVTPMLVFGLEIQIDGCPGMISVSVPASFPQREESAFGRGWDGLRP